MKVIEPKLLKFLEEAPLFFQPWWLEVVSPGAWDYVTAHRGQEIAAVLSYTFKVRLNQFRLIEMPPLTPYLGPWLRPSTAKYANRLGEEKDLMSELLKGLPAFAMFHQDFHPQVTNWLPFYWQGFSQSTLYTYRIDDTRDLEKLWNETRDNVRTDIKKAEKQVEVLETDNMEDFLRVYRLTFSRQDKGLPYSEDLVRHLDTAATEHDARKILVAKDPDGQIHAAVYLVIDRTTVYYLLGGGDPQLRNSGATSLLIWEAIRWASGQAKQFDFEGSIVESIERFVRSFGARQVAYFRIKKCNSKIVRLYRSLWKWTHKSQWG